MPLPMAMLLGGLTNFLKEAIKTNDGKEPTKKVKEADGNFC